MLSEILHENLKSLRDELYKRYSRKEIASFLGVGEFQVSRLLSGKNQISYKQYLILKSKINS